MAHAKPFQITPFQITPFYMTPADRDRWSPMSARSVVIPVLPAQIEVA